MSARPQIPTHLDADCASGQPTARVPLTALLRSRVMTVPALLELALPLLDALAGIHRRGLVHHDIRPDHVLLPGPPECPIWAGASLAWAGNGGAAAKANALTATSAYLAPEQTGRTGRIADHRADLYAFGVLLYECLSGRLPFDADDALQRLHDILTLIPLPPGEIAPATPAVLSHIVMRLLEKEAERRYQSADGLAHDLGRLREQLGQGSSTGFALGEHDFAARLTAPTQLIGRTAELQVLQSSFANALEGRCRGVLVAGAPGVGKTTLIGALRPLVAARGGWFVSGKFDQFRQDRSADAVHQVLRAIGRLLLAEPEAVLAPLRARMLAALGPNNGVLSGTNPEFSLLLGVAPQAPIADDPVKEGQRLVRATIDVLCAIASRERPLVIVLDDLQWAASTPIAFVEALLTETRLEGLLLVGAYREAEIDVAHPLRATWARWQRLDTAPPLLTLHNLDRPDQVDLLGAMLRMVPEAASELADALASQGSGNPFDLVELVNSLRVDGVLVRAGGDWRWDATAVRRHVARSEVLGLLGARLRRLPARTRRLLDILACMGGEVELELLGVAAAVSAGTLGERLAPALDEGLLLASQTGDSAVRFCHDRVQQAASGRTTPPSRRRLHLALARRLAASPRFLHFAAEQYLPAVGAVREAEECRRVAGLFQQNAAGLRLINPLLAERLLAAALGLLGPAGDSPLRAQLQIDHHAALFGLGRLDDADAAYGVVEGGQADAVQRGDSACVQVSSLSNRGRLQEALALGMGVLQQLGIGLSEATPGDEVKRCLQTMTEKAGDDLQRPTTCAPHVLAAGKLIYRMLPPAYRACDLQRMTWLVGVAMRLWTVHGPCAELVGPIAHLYTLGPAALGDSRRGYAALRHVLAVGEARGFEPGASQARFLLGRHWMEPLEQSVACLQQAREGLLRGGDLQSACFTWLALLAAQLDRAPTLEAYGDEVEAAIAFGIRTGNDLVGSTFTDQRQLVRMLRAEAGAGHTLPDDCSGDAIQRARHHITRALVAALFGDTPTLVQHAAQTRSSNRMVETFYSSGLAMLLQGLALAAQMRTEPAGPTAAQLAEFDAGRAELAERAAGAPGNFAHLLRWLDAERAWAVGEPWAAAKGFEAALREAAARQRPWHAALIAERAAGFHLAQGLEHAGHALLAEARRRYDDWGARAKVRQLDEAHPFLQAQAQAALGAAATGGASADTIDLLGIVRASQALGSETSGVRLHARVVALLGEMTGATTVRVVLWNDELQQWRLPAHDGDGDGAAPSPAVEAAAALELLPQSVLRYVERTREVLLVDDATRDDRFAADPWLRGAECCSLLAVPILHHGAMRAMLLLENRLSRAAFTADRLDAVMLITGQLAVSLANVQLYESLEQRVQQRTQELRETQSQLVTAARQAGMAEIATNVLHNVGNVLNSVNIAAGLVSTQLRSSKAKGLARAVQLMGEHAADLGDFLVNDAKGRLLPGYLRELSSSLQTEQQGMADELAGLCKSVDHIKEIVSTQQSYAGASRLVESVSVRELIDDALRMNGSALVRHKVTVVKELAELPALPLDRHRVLQVLVNLISNAKHAVAQTDDGAARITLRVGALGDDGRLRIHVADNGEGIAADNLPRVFSHGFTTRKNGHGFGLHSCVMAAQEMGGTLLAHSDGAGLGATFTLELPIDTQEHA